MRVGAGEREGYSVASGNFGLSYTIIVSIVFIPQNVSNCTLYVHFIVCYLDKAVFKIQ